MTILEDADRSLRHDSPIRVVVLDDHEIIRRGITALLDSELDIVVVGEAASAAEAIMIVESTQTHVALLDVRLGAIDPLGGIRACREIRANNRNVACAMLTSFADAQTRAAASDAGAAGYLLKQIQGNRIVESVRQLASGRTLASETLLECRGHAVEALPSNAFALLTPQERLILENITKGMTNRQIATAMNLAEKTVKNYVSNVLTKLGMHRRTEAAVLWAGQLQGEPREATRSEWTFGPAHASPRLVARP